MISATHRRAIRSLVKKIDEGSFSQDDILLLLINIRDLIENNDSFTKELAHFIAHPERSRGVCYDDMNLRAVILNLMAGQLKLLSTPAEILNIKKNLYDIIFNIGLQKWINREPAIVGKNKISERKSIKSLVDNFYDFDKSTQSYRLKNPANFNQVIKIVNNCVNNLSTYPIIAIEEVIKQFNADVKTVFKKHIADVQYRDSILNCANDISMCIFSLFQDAQFQIFNGDQGYFVLDKDIVHDPDKFHGLDDLKDDAIKKSIRKDLENAHLKLSGSVHVKQIPVLSNFISSNIRLGDYVDETLLEKYVEGSFQRDFIDPPGSPKTLPDILFNIQVKRDDNGKLKLFKADD